MIHSFTTHASCFDENLQIPDNLFLTFKIRKPERTKGFVNLFFSLTQVLIPYIKRILHSSILRRQRYRICFEYYQFPRKRFISLLFNLSKTVFRKGKTVKM